MHQYEPEDFPGLPHIRWIARRDHPEVAAIANPWSNWTDEKLIATRRDRSVIAMVIEVRDRVVGYMVYRLGKHEIDLLDLAVHGRFRNAGLGRMLIDKIKSKMSAHRRNRIDVEIRETNLGGVLFLKKMGFEADRLLRGHYEDTGEDAYHMVHRPPLTVYEQWIMNGGTPWKKAA